MLSCHRCLTQPAKISVKCITRNLKHDIWFKLGVNERFGTNEYCICKSVENTKGQIVLPGESPFMWYIPYGIILLGLVYLSWNITLLVYLIWIICSCYNPFWISSFVWCNPYEIGNVWYILLRISWNIPLLLVYLIWNITLHHLAYLIWNISFNVVYLIWNVPFHLICLIWNIPFHLV